ncbi:Cerato-platanin-domain-containing protein [Scleroderma yunnanense]
MKVAPILVFPFALFLTAMSQTPTQFLCYDVFYDNSNESLDYLACSSGSNSLENKGYATLGQLSTFPDVSGVYTVTVWDSPACGTCYNVTYGSTTIYVLAVDTAPEGFNVAEAALNALTDGQATQFGRIDMQTTPVDARYGEL